VHIGNSVNLFASGTKKYSWKPLDNISCDTCSNTLWKGTSKQTYCVVGTDEFGCVDSACVTIDIFNICGDLANIKMPNAFSPNSDGTNDFYKPIVELPDCYSETLFRIYDRWGTQLFETEDLNVGWDGTFKGKQMPIETYVWYIKVRNYLGEEKMMKGDVILLR
jgi:gliding motility-associated-like protein